MNVLRELTLSYQKIGAPQSILLALSGGADSVALLHLLSELQKTNPFELICVHINHGLREASAGEEQFVKSLCEKAGIRLFTKRVSVPKTGNLEEAARTARYKAIHHVQTETGAQVIALAHHANDQAETVLMHLMRGAGLDGIAGMSEFRPPYWRPLLRVPQKDLLAYLNQRQFKWVEDESNQDTRLLRNNLRHGLLSLLEEQSPGVVLRLAQTADILKAEQNLLHHLQNAWLNQYAKMQLPFNFLLINPWMHQELAMKRRLVRALCRPVCGELDYAQTERLVAFVMESSASSLNLPRNAKAILSKERLHILPDDVKLTKLTWQQPLAAPAKEGMGDCLREQVVDEASIASAVMRQVSPDDVISPLGMQGTQPIRKYLIAKGIDRPFRPFWPVYALGNQVLWVPGCGVSSTAAVTQNTVSKVKLVFSGILPHEINENGGKTSCTNNPS
ncbi:MAG: tRNA lysidine(34) synthetase TilS [Clostridiales bacterium]|nr:tRNA lysidine(34) synthetase TilS [Clostridiales bacterium]HHT08069.1 tRNA lysidine(34) synthetase TilS [Clostridiales bacterium]